MDYQTIIGLEIHVELLTDTKLFCHCPTGFGAKPNSQVCPTCLGLPGSLPVLRPQAVTQALRAALALDCSINEVSRFARKNYFYPDLPKGYQITQTIPLAQDGKVKVGEQEIAISRLHLEEDSGKSVHTGDSTLVDYNRSGIPLAEIVTSPCIKSPAQAREFLEALRQIMQYAQVSDCRMDQGSLRCDANISLQGEEPAGARTEIKNLNSFKAVEQALGYEIRRQSEILEQGKKVKPETMHWNEVHGVTVPMRVKEESPDYRLFPDPDLPPLVVSGEEIQACRQSLPELPQGKFERFRRKYELPDMDIQVLTKTRGMADWFEETVQAGADPQAAANWVCSEVTRLLNREGRDISSLAFTPGDLARLIALNQQGEISGTAAKQVLAEMFLGGGDPAEIMQRLGVAQVSDADSLLTLVNSVLAENREAVSDYHGGKKRALGHLMGQAMKKSQGRANPRKLKGLLLKELNKG